MSNLVEHARVELTRLGEEPEIIEQYLRIIQAFADMGHSGYSAEVATLTLNNLLQFKNLMPLTNDPSEWEYHGPKISGHEGGLWQSKRNSEAFSENGGKTFYLLSERDGDNASAPRHTAVDYAS